MGLSGQIDPKQYAAFLASVLHYPCYRSSSMPSVQHAHLLQLKNRQVTGLFDRRFFVVVPSSHRLALAFPAK
jgi:hypothetical protein